MVSAYSYLSTENKGVGNEKQLQAHITLTSGMYDFSCLIFDNLLRRDERKAFYDGVIWRTSIRKKRYLAWLDDVAR